MMGPAPGTKVRVRFVRAMAYVPPDGTVIVALKVSPPSSENRKVATPTVPLDMISTMTSYASYAAPATVIRPVDVLTRVAVTAPAAPTTVPVSLQPHCGPPATERP